jgi:signal transduction histidine kinase
MMRLYEYIQEHIELILEEWERFARSIQPSGGDMNVSELRDHAEEMLRTIAADMQRPQTETQAAQKSKGRQSEPSKDTAAQTHAVGRLESGFSINLLVAEYRALRASVLRLWSNESSGPQEGVHEDTVRFNEAIDQALAESVKRYSDAVSKQQDIFIGILGHDLRTPLQSLSYAAQLLNQSPAGIDLAGLAARMHNSIRRMTGMINNLLDFTQSRIGGGINLTTKDADLAAVAEEVVADFNSHQSFHNIRNCAQNDCRGEFDAGRVAQIYQNLIGNALQYGAKDEPISVETIEASGEVIIKVCNRGKPIPKGDQHRIFDLLYRDANVSTESSISRNVGLGLYIVKAIASAHGGCVAVNSSEEHGTEFTVRLPKRQAGKGSS